MPGFTIIIILHSQTVIFSDTQLFYCQNLSKCKQLSHQSSPIQQWIDKCLSNCAYIDWQRTTQVHLWEEQVDFVSDSSSSPECNGTALATTAINCKTFISKGWQRKWIKITRSITQHFLFNIISWGCVSFFFSLRYKFNSGCSIRENQVNFTADALLHT